MSDFEVPVTRRSAAVILGGFVGATLAGAAALARTPAEGDPVIQSAAQPEGLKVFTRGEWGADEGATTWGPEYTNDVHAVTVHHTASRTYYEVEEVPDILRAIFRFQAIERGWGDIGYNFLVDRYGRAWEGRLGGISSPSVGAHALGYNYGTCGIALIGNYTADEPPAEALETIARIAAYKLPGLDPREVIVLPGGNGDVALPRVFGHNRVNATACPGGVLDGRLAEIAERAAVLVGQGVTLV